MTKTAVILPTWNRVQQAAACTRRLLDTSDADVWIVSEDNPLLFGDDLFAHPRFHVAQTTPGMTAVQKWNYGLLQSDAKGYSAYMLGADDIWPVTDGWLEKAIEQLSCGAGCVSWHDGVTDGAQLGTHFVLSREFIVARQHGVLCVPHYRSWGLDVETTARAQKAGAYHWLRDVLVEHRHPHFGKAPMDDTYRVGYSKHAYDMMILKARERANWPDDFEAVIR